MRVYTMLLLGLTMGGATGCGDSGGVFDGDGGETGGVCGELQEGEGCEPDTCHCDPDGQVLSCLPEDGYGGSGDYVCVDTTPDGGAQAGEACTWLFDCESGFCFRAEEDGPLQCQDACLDVDEPLHGSFAGNCCSGIADGADGGTCK